MVMITFPKLTRFALTGSLNFFLLAVATAGSGHGMAAHSNPVSMKTLFDFSSSGNEPQWVAVNDGVMGGLSAGGPRIADGVLHFSGTLSLENNGGFSSVRTIRWTSDLREYKAVVLRVRGDGRTYQLRISTDARFRGSPVSYGMEFATRADEWVEVRLPFTELKPTWRGRKLEGPPLDLAKVEEIGLLIGDNREGPFSMEVDWMKLQ